MRTRILRGFKKFNGSQKDNPCAVRCRKKKTVVKEEPVLRRRMSMAGVEMLSSGQELKC